MRILFCFLLLSLITSCYNVERNCNDFKTGTFEFNYIIDGVEKTGTFTRTKDYSIDFYENKIDSASIRWINDCEFVLKKVNPKRMADEDALHFKILTTTKDYYTFEYKLAVKKANKKEVVKKGKATKID